MCTNGQIDLLRELEILLQKQIRLAQEGDTRGIEALARKADIVVRKIGETAILEKAEFKQRREQLQKLYDRLCLAVSAQKADVLEKLGRIRKGKKTIGTYRGII